MKYRFMVYSLLLHGGLGALLWQSHKELTETSSTPLVLELVFEEDKIEEIEPALASKTPPAQKNSSPHKEIKKDIKMASSEPQMLPKAPMTEPISSDTYIPPRIQGSHNPMPAYPYVARKRGHEGRVEVTIHLMPSGAIEEVVVSQSSGHEELDESVREVLQQWKFEAAKRGENQINSEIKLGFTFSLENSHVFLS